MKLSEAENTQTVEIISFEDKQIEQKLIEMGCLAGEEVYIQMKAPSGDPIAIRIGETLISLRLEDAQNIIVKPCN